MLKKKNPHFITLKFNIFGGVLVHVSNALDLVR